MKYDLKDFPFIQIEKLSEWFLKDPEPWAFHHCFSASAQIPSVWAKSFVVGEEGGDIVRFSGSYLNNPKLSKEKQ